MGEATESILTINNYIDCKHIPPITNEYIPVINPSTSSQIANVAISNSTDVNAAVTAAHNAFTSWSRLTVKARAAIMLKFHALIRENANELADLIVLENGKNKTEALADIAKGNETVEYACSLPQLMQGKIDRVSGEVTCKDRRDALGVVVSIVPFNFPFMVPMWTLPIALVTGNTIVLKPSEKVPLTTNRVMDLIEQAGFPPGVVNLIQGTRDAVESLIDHPLVKAVTFVGSSPIAKIVSERCHSLNKRCTALGGAKNHLVALPDCDVNGTASDVVVSYAGCAGQRCMAASVLLVVGPKDGQSQKALLDAVIEKASKIEPGTEPGRMGAVIDDVSFKKIMSYIEQSEKDGAQVLLDGRSWIEKMKNVGGNYIGPTVILHSNKTDKAMNEEIFGPVLSVYHVPTWHEAIEIENANPFGNAAAIYTTNGGYADWFCSRFRASMLGVNIGIPVPREPFSFGGLYGTRSKFGDMDITGDGAIEFFTNRIKITSKWPAPTAPEYMLGEEQHEVGATQNGGTDHANFAGRM
jgi:malonate-semialdehyde dehydrogenase (acetylating)/methylmalonate-semialdehyde dehydrogenase